MYPLSLCLFGPSVRVLFGRSSATASTSDVTVNVFLCVCVCVGRSGGGLELGFQELKIIERKKCILHLHYYLLNLPTIPKDWNDQMFHCFIVIITKRSLLVWAHSNVKEIKRNTIEFCKAEPNWENLQIVNLNLDGVTNCLKHVFFSRH